ncbi:hypothetical protein CsSME_00031617 [Camellia sinensis var. sinensis]
MLVDCERLTWLYCLGVPPNLWNPHNFKRIGELWGEVVAIHEETLSLASLKYGKVKVITSQLETIDKTVTMESKGISYPIKVVECFEQRHGHHSGEVANGSTSWFAEGSHGRVDQSSVSKQLDKEEDDADNMPEMMMWQSKVRWKRPSGLTWK